MPRSPSAKRRCPHPSSRSPIPNPQTENRPDEKSRPHFSSARGDAPAQYGARFGRYHHRLGGDAPRRIQGPQELSRDGASQGAAPPLPQPPGHTYQTLRLVRVDGPACHLFLGFASLTDKVRSKNAHWKLADIRPRHWDAVTRMAGLGEAAPLLHEIAGAVCSAEGDRGGGKRHPPGVPGRGTRPHFRGTTRRNCGTEGVAVEGTALAAPTPFRCNGSEFERQEEISKTSSHLDRPGQCGGIRVTADYRVGPTGSDFS